MTKISSEVHLFSAEGASLGEQIAGQLRYQIMRGTIKQGEILSENQLADDYGTSRAPVRDALKVLSSEGLIQLGRTGVTVLGMSLEDMKELYDVRFLIEGFALERLVQNYDQRMSRELERITDKMELSAKHGDAVEFSRYDIQFHAAIVELSQHRRIYHLWNNIQHVIFTALLIATIKRFEQNKNEIETVINNHRQIVIALDEGDLNAIKNMMQEHYSDTFLTVSNSVSSTKNE